MMMISINTVRNSTFLVKRIKKLSKTFKMYFKKYLIKVSSRLSILERIQFTRYLSKNIWTK